jgi:hypothetical protein
MRLRRRGDRTGAFVKADGAFRSSQLRVVVIGL